MEEGRRGSISGERVLLLTYDHLQTMAMFGLPKNPRSLNRQPLIWRAWWSSFRNRRSLPAPWLR
jgi:hypothetical protein